MGVDRGQAGKVLAQAAPELLRIWRLARCTARPDVFPGLIDGVMGPFLARAAALLAAGGEPEAVWPGVTGTVRWSGALASRGEITTEWAVAMEVLSAALESMRADPSVAEWLARAVAAAEVGSSALGDPTAARPAGVLLVKVYSSLARPQSEGG